jgi:hypothetical protein
MVATAFPDAKWGAWMQGNPDAVVYIGLGIIVAMIIWRYIVLKIISLCNRSLYIKINNITSPTPITDEYRRKAEEEQSKKHLRVNKG